MVIRLVLLIICKPFRGCSGRRIETNIDVEVMGTRSCGFITSAMMLNKSSDCMNWNKVTIRLNEIAYQMLV